jgi:hypothetical protein
MNSATISLLTPSDACESSGTLSARNDQPNSDAQSESIEVPGSPTDIPNSPHDGEEEALESHEVIELQKFSERKAWIEEKIKVRSLHGHIFSLALILISSFWRICRR